VFANQVVGYGSKAVRSATSLGDGDGSFATGLVVTTGDEYEAALRSLPEAHSLALRLQTAGAADEVICEYLHIERECLGTLLDLAHRKLESAIRSQHGQAGNNTHS
jgi:hypothetical protein